MKFDEKVAKEEAYEQANDSHSEHYAFIRGAKWQFEQDKKLIESLQADGIHTCHDKCQRAACVAGRERDAWKAMCDKLAVYLNLISVKSYWTPDLAMQVLAQYKAFIKEHT